MQFLNNFTNQLAALENKLISFLPSFYQMFKNLFAYSHIVFLTKKALGLQHPSALYYSHGNTTLATNC